MTSSPPPAPTAVDPELVASIEEFLKPLILGLEPEVSRGPGRPRVLPALALWAGIVVCVLRGLGSQRDIWRLLTRIGLWHSPRFTFSDDAVYSRLKAQAGDGLRTVFERVTELLRTASGRWQVTAPPLAAFAQGVFILDEMTLERVFKCLPTLRKTSGPVLGGKLSAIFDMRAQLWQALIFQPRVEQNSKVAARELLARLPSGSLILADLGYFAFKWFDDLTQAGFFCISRLRAKTSHTVVHTLYAGPELLDAIVWLGAYRADRARYAVRLVRFRARGQLRTYITNVLDPRVLPVAEIARLYARRWDIEMMFDLVKTHFRLDFLWSAHLTLIQHQVWAVFIVAQSILGLRNDLARQAQADVFEISLELFTRYLPQYLADGLDPIASLVERGRFLLIIRPSKRTKLSVPDAPSPPITSRPRICPPPVSPAMPTRPDEFLGLNGLWACPYGRVLDHARARPAAGDGMIWQSVPDAKNLTTPRP